MKKIMMMALVAMVALGANAQEKKAEKVNPNKPVFTVVKENKITSIKDQNPLRYVLELLYPELF